MILCSKISVATLWGILIVICCIPAIFIFSIIKKFEAVTSNTPADLETVEDEAI